MLAGLKYASDYVLNSTESLPFFFLQFFFEKIFGELNSLCKVNGVCTSLVASYIVNFCCKILRRLKLALELKAMLFVTIKPR